MPKPTPVVVAIGMEDPFARMKPATAKILNAGFRALRTKSPAQAREAFGKVVAAHPDHAQARFHELRAAALAGDFAAVPAMWRELLARDFVGYASRLDNAEDMTALRESQQGLELVQIRDEMRAAFTRGLQSGVVFVARGRSGPGPRFDDKTGQARIDLGQEAFHMDPSTGRIRRLTDTGGRVVAIHPDAQRERLIVLSARALKRGEKGTSFDKPEASVLSLTTLERSGPYPIGTAALAVDLCFTPAGEPVWSVLGEDGTTETALTVDATGAVVVPIEGGCGEQLAITSVDPTHVVHTRPSPEGVALSDDGMSITGVDTDKPVRADLEIRAESLVWSPGKRRFAYAGSADRCELSLKTDLKEKPAPNTLFVWDAESRKAARVKSAPTTYEVQWIDDNRLAYESGLVPGVTIHDFATGAEARRVKTTAGLFGVPVLPCDNGEVHALAR